MRLVRSFIRRDFLLAVSYRSAFLLQFATILCAVPILFFLSEVFAGVQVDALEPYGGHYFAFILLGMAFQDYVTLSQSTFTTSIREHQMMGTLEIIMLSPTPVPVILLCSSLWGYLFTSLRFAVYVAMGLAFGMSLGSANLLSFAALVLLSIVSFAALGILIAAVTILIKRGEGLVALVTGITLALGGVAYPISVLPEALQWVAQVLPFTHALSGVRKALLVGASPSDLAVEFAALGAFAAVLFPLGLWAFQRATRRARVTGTLGQY